MSQPKTPSLSARAPAEQTPERLDRWLARNFPLYSRARFQSLLHDGHVLINGQVIKEARYKVKAFEHVEAFLPAVQESNLTGENLPLVILHEDEDLIVLDKPAGLVVHPAAGHETGTLVHALIAHCGRSLSGIGGERRPGIVHRLDKDTSGLLVVAKNDFAHHGLATQFAAHGQDGCLSRHYLALVWGHVEKNSALIDAPLARSIKNRQKITISHKPNARAARTYYETLERLNSKPLTSMLRCRLETGRTHQIRVHLTAIGHALLGDKTYGTGFSASANNLPPDALCALQQLDRQALHANHLGFVHPRSNQTMRFDSAIPPEMERLLICLRTRAESIGLRQ